MYIPGIWASSKRSSAPAATSFLAVGHETSPYVSVYPFSSGLGTKYANPATLPQGNVRRLTFNSTGSVLALAVESSFSYGGASKSIMAFPWSSSGFGTIYSDPSVLPIVEANSPEGYSIAFNSAGTAIVLGVSYSGVGSRATAWTWSNASGFGTKYGNPAAPTGGVQVQAAKFNPADSSLVLGINSSSLGISAYRWTNATGWGNKYTNPSVATPYGISFNNSGNAIVSSRTTTPYINGWPFSDSTGFGTKYGNPATLPPSSGRGIAFNPAGDTVSLAHDTNASFSVYPFSAGFGTKYADPATVVAAAGWDTTFNTAGTAVAYALLGSSPYVSVYPWSAGFGTKYANPATLPTGNGLSVAFI